jgi:hypothetical protein
MIFKIHDRRSAATSRTIAGQQQARYRNDPASLVQGWCYCSNGNMRFQSFFMLITVQLFFLASS